MLIRTNETKSYISNYKNFQHMKALKWHRFNLYGEINISVSAI